MNTCRLAEVMVKRKAILFGDFILSSGKRSRFYLDLRRLLGDPESLIATSELLLEKARTLEPFDTVVGLATAGIPWASALAILSGKKLAYIRSESKEYGTKSILEGSPDKGVCILVDDVATTGSTLVKSARTLRDMGVCEVKAALVIVDRLQGARENLKAEGIDLYSIATVLDIIDCLRARQYIDEETAEIVRHEIEHQR